MIKNDIRVNNKKRYPHQICTFKDWVIAVCNNPDKDAEFSPEFKEVLEKHGVEL